MPNKVKTFSHARGLEEFLKEINFDEERYSIEKVREEVYGSENNPCYLCDVTYKNKVAEDLPTPTEMLEEFKRLAKEFAPTCYRDMYPSNSGQCERKLVEVCLFDHHFGQLSWKPEVGANYDIKIAKKLALEAIADLLTQIPKDTDKFVLPIGNDFFNVNSSSETTLKGTPQSEDCRWQKTFTEGARLVTTIIDMLAEVAPVEVIIVTGNHDTERSFYLGEYLYGWYHNCDFVSIENSPNLRKYYQWGKVGIVFTHGEKGDLKKLHTLMADEAPKIWVSTKFREGHVGHLHKKGEYFFVLSEENSFTIRIMPSLVAKDDYHHGEGYSHMRKSIAILWDSEKGQRAEYVHTV